MPWGGFGRSRGYGGLREGWRRKPAVRIPAVQWVVQKKGHPSGKWVAEAWNVERCRYFICRPQTASHAGVYWEQVGCLCRPRPTKGRACGCESLGTVRRDGAATPGSEGDESHAQNEQ